MQEKPVTQEKPIFGIRKFYIRNLSFETPSELGQINQSSPLENRMEVHIDHKALPNENDYEVILKLNLTSTIDKQVIFTIKLEQVGIFRIENFSEDQREQILEIECPHRLYPYASSAVSQITALGGFPALVLQSVDFASIYHQKRKEQQ